MIYLIDRSKWSIGSMVFKLIKSNQIKIDQSIRSIIKIDQYVRISIWIDWLNLKSINLIRQLIKLVKRILICTVINKCHSCRQKSTRSCSRAEKQPSCRFCASTTQRHERRSPVSATRRPARSFARGTWRRADGLCATRLALTKPRQAKRGSEIRFVRVFDVKIFEGILQF